jgi:hypothetical protein
MPSISEMTAVSRGFLASNSSTTRGRPPVMSLVNWWMGSDQPRRIVIVMSSKVLVDRD